MFNLIKLDIFSKFPNKATYTYRVFTELRHKVNAYLWQKKIFLGILQIKFVKFNIFNF